jgi:hypothetical protein
VTTSPGNAEVRILIASDGSASVGNPVERDSRLETTSAGKAEVMISNASEGSVIESAGPAVGSESRLVTTSAGRADVSTSIALGALAVKSTEMSPEIEMLDGRRSVGKAMLSGRSVTKVTRLPSIMLVATATRLDPPGKTVAMPTPSEMIVESCAGSRESVCVGRSSSISLALGRPP